MEYLIALLSALVALGIGAGAVYLLLGRRQRQDLAAAEAGQKAAEAQAERLLQETEAKRKALVLESEEEVRRQRAAGEAELRERRAEMQRQERRLSNREDNLDRRTEALEKRERGQALREQQVDQRLAEVEEIKRQQFKTLETVSGLTAADARELVLRNAEEDAKHELSRQYYELQQRFKEEADQRGKQLLADSIQRLASDVVSESTV
ncbi:MAG: DUF3552 domain-containing protein, partial [SAR202 cluster bacterium]|nr:DUF3552 domain-containing protein [SAR202 cluster bacterium]